MTVAKYAYARLDAPESLLRLARDTLLDTVRVNAIKNDIKNDIMLEIRDNAIFKIREIKEELKDLGKKS